MTIKFDDLLKPEGAIQLLQEFREVLRHTVTAHDLDEIEASTEVNDADSGLWVQYRFDLHFLLGVMYGLNLGQNAFDRLAHPLLKMMDERLMYDASLASALKVVKHAVRAHEMATQRSKP